MYGDFFFSGSGFKRSLIADKTVGIISSSFNDVELTYLTSHGLSLVSGSYIGHNVSNIPLTSNDEVVYDSLMIHPLNYTYANGVNPVAYNPALSGSELFNIPNISATGSALIFLNVANSVVSSSLSVKASDNIWLYTFPFKSTYKNLIRVSQPSYTTPYPIITSVSYSSNFTVKDTTVPIQVSRITSILFGSSSFTNADNPNTFGFLVDGIMISGAAGYAGLNVFDRDRNELTNLEAINKAYFGVGLGLHGLTNVGLAKRNISISSIDFTFFVAPIIRGWKYGIFDGNSRYTKALYRTGHFGQLRDMLEQRLFTKTYDQKRRQVLAAPIQVRFVTSSVLYSQSLDYRTATSASYNTRDSGAWDYEYRSGQPFFDIERI
jgi:hypothetical protein